MNIYIPTSIVDCLKAFLLYSLIIVVPLGIFFILSIIDYFNDLRLIRREWLEKKQKK